MKIIGAQTDVETEMSLGPSWTYRDSTKVKIFYAMDDKETCIILTNLRERAVVYCFYRKKDLVDLLYQDFGQVKANEFIIDPTNSKFVSDEQFCQYLHQINDNISRHKGQYHHLFDKFSGPQCYEDLLDPVRLNYNVNYKNNSKKEPELAVPKKDCIEGLKETFDNSLFSLRVCLFCEKIRVLGLRAAQKYPLCYYDFQGIHHFINFQCNQLHGAKCASPCEDESCDVKPVSFDGIMLDGTYILYSKFED